MKLYDSIMVDIETTGLNPVHSHILQLSAVRFNMADKTIDHENMFNRTIMPIMPHRYWDEGTREWWLDTNPELLGKIINGGDLPENVFRDFKVFVEQTKADEPVRFWSKPLSFDYPFVDSYFKQLNMGIPFRYYRAVDLNSFILGRGHRNAQEFAGEVPFDGEKHNAIFDVLYQIKLAFSA